ncbi:AAA family ATPase [Paeniroseomonas aquatica]|uniref:AAA family ATPase n=1 Tax=Paeniroseomonas aquatica TaxID=373043 RepID=UPI003620D9F0
MSQVGPRSMQRLMELQAQTGMTIRGLGDREQCQTIEAGDSIALLQRAIPRHNPSCCRRCDRKPTISNASPACSATRTI